jgi:hypothetical protein
VYALMGFKVFQKLLTTLTFINFLFVPVNFENACWNYHQNSLLFDWSMYSIADLSLAAGYTVLPSSVLLMSQWPETVHWCKCILFSYLSLFSLRSSVRLRTEQIAISSRNFSLTCDSRKEMWNRIASLRPP